MNSPNQQLSDSIISAQRHGQSGQFPEMMAICQHIIKDYGKNVDILLEVGALLLNFGFLSRARECFTRICNLAPNDMRAVINLASLEHAAGDHAKAHRLYVMLQKSLPNHPIIRRNLLHSMEYDPSVPDTERLEQARAWGKWAVARVGNSRSRPAIYPLNDRPLRVGYVSADLCQHTVGLFVKGVIEVHNSERVSIFVYHAGQVNDWVTEAIRAVSRFRDVATLNDEELAVLIRQDKIDVLIDLSGHTAGSRLTMFAHRPAPVQISWLGYFATTGLSCMDAVLLDEWHAPAGTEVQFVEPIISLSAGRLCYQPVQWAPAKIAPLPFLKAGHVTFGCFNNTAKYNEEVFDGWAKILTAIPDSRLILKWRTFADDWFCQTVRDCFAQRGVAVERIELRGASFHAGVLQEYADIDIALDPFPFSGGLTSCEALWAGVPVVTWPQTRVVSRQTFAFLATIGLPELAAEDADDYVRIAVTLAKDINRLTELRSTLRARMSTSQLMDVHGFTRQLEQCFIDLHQEIAAKEKMLIDTTKTILHVGSGHRKNGAKLPAALQSSEWREIRLDVDPANEPDIVGSMLDMASVQSASMDAIYSAHNIEHVYFHEVSIMLKEFLRVLKPDGFLIVTCPDLQTVSLLVAEDKLTKPVYQSQAGPITPLDILYGYSAAIAAGNHFMAHKCGFTLSSLTQELRSAGFKTIAGKRRTNGLDLWVVATKQQINESEIRKLAGNVLPE